jgi:hypothetical protein
MIVNISIHVPDVAPNTPEAVTTTDCIEHHMTPSLTFITALLHRDAAWWMDVDDGETRYMPENVNELS